MQRNGKSDPKAKAKKSKGLDDALVNGDEPVILRGDAAWQAVADANVAASEAQPEVPAPGDARVGILVDKNIHIVCGDVRKAMANDAELFRKNGTIVRVVQPAEADPNDEAMATSGMKVTRSPHAPHVQTADKHFVRERIAQKCHLIETRMIAGKQVPVHVLPADWLVGSLCSDPGPMRELDGILPGPTIDGDGDLINTRGYNEPTRFYLSGATPGLTIPESPTQEAAIAAAKIIGEILVDFPFAAEADRSRWLLLLLTACVRHLVRSTPIGLVTANTAGSGKTNLAKIISIIAHGNSGPKLMVWPNGNGPGSADENEIRKMLASNLQAGESFMVIDNIERGSNFGSSTLDAFVTSESFYDRKLGLNDGSMVGGPNRCLVLATGNAITPKGDTADRTLVVELVSLETNPRERSLDNFIYPELLGHVAANRARYLGAALTIWRAWIQAGQPQPLGENWGSFEDFVKKPVAVVRWLGWEDPVKGRARRAYADESETQALRELLVTWKPAMGIAPLRPSDITRAMQNGRDAFAETIASKDFSEAVLAIGPWRVIPTTAALGKRLKAYAQSSVKVQKEDESWVKLSLKIDLDTRRGTNLYSVEEEPIDTEG